MSYELRTESWLPVEIEKVFAFFCDAHNLEAITPDFLQFEVLTPRPIRMDTGTLLDYRIKLHGFPIRWRTRISCWEPPFKFVDEQLKGPYRKWIHTHTFETHDGGTLVRDHVEYNHWATRIGERFFVRPDLDKIFAYRQKRIRELLVVT